MLLATRALLLAIGLRYLALVRALRFVRFGAKLDVLCLQVLRARARNPTQP